MFKAITPRFINRLDVYLLTHHPVLWTSKIHYALWHGLALWLLSALVGWFMPVNLKGRLEYELWYFLFTVVGFLILCFWIYHYQSFNKEKNFGYKKAGDEYKNFFLVFVVVAVFLMMAWPFEIIYNNRVAKMYTDKEVIADINTLNINHPYTASTSHIYYNWHDSVTQQNFVTLKKLSAAGNAFFSPYYIRLDSVRFPDLLTEYQLYRLYKPDYEVNSVRQKVTDFLEVANKYEVYTNSNADEIAAGYLKLLKRQAIPVNEFYGQSTMLSNDYYSLTTVFENICRAKFSTLFIFKSDALWTLFYFIFCITVMLLLFRITYWKQYLITIVVMLLYPLITLIITELTYWTGIRRGSFYQAAILMLIIAGLLSFIRTTQEKRRFLPVYNILNQLFYVSIAFFPLLLVSFLNDTTNLFHKWDTNPYYYSDYYSMQYKDPLIIYQQQLAGYMYSYWQDEFRKWMEICKYGGILLFIILLPVTKELFVRQISLPRKT